MVTARGWLLPVFSFGSMNVIINKVSGIGILFCRA